MRRTTILTAVLACLTLLALGVGSALRADEPPLEGRVAALEKEVLALKERLAKLEAAGAAKPARRTDRAATMEDLNSLRNLAGLMILSGKPPLKDGALDIYAFVRNGDIAPGNYGLLRSKRLGKGPADAEIERGDYSGFPWERYRGDGKDLRGPGVVPILWEKDAGADGAHVVAMNDGSARLVSAEELAKLLGR